MLAAIAFCSNEIQNREGVGFTPCLRLRMDAGGVSALCPQAVMSLIAMVRISRLSRSAQFWAINWRSRCPWGKWKAQRGSWTGRMFGSVSTGNVHDIGQSHVCAMPSPHADLYCLSVLVQDDRLQTNLYARAECVTTNGKRAAVRAAPESDECLLGLPDQFQILHILAWSESSIPCDNNRGARQRSLVMHAHVMLADIAATFSDTTASFSLPLYSAQTQHSACRQGKAEGEVHRDEGRDKGLMRSLNRLMKKADVLGQAAVGAPSALAGDEEWALKLPPALAQGHCESLVFEARGCWWETTMIKDMASEGQDKMTEGLDEVRVRLPFKRACVAVVDIRLRLTRTQAEKRRLQVLKAAHDSRLQPLRALLIPHDSDGKAETGSWCILLATIQALGSHAPSALSAAAGPHPARIEPSHNALGDFGVASSHHSFALQAVYRLILSAGIELSLIGYLRAMKSVHNIEQDGQDEVWGQARSVAVDLLLDKGCEFIVQVRGPPQLGQIALSPEIYLIERVLRDRKKRLQD